ncbi:Uncharacterised protein [Mycobacteroides abscessus subsp. abscessus]|nr:Uncharacterised protein [Mycobacteroides abscessus subsp. abscessus]
MTSLSSSSRLWFPQSVRAVTEQIDVESAELIRNALFVSDLTRLKSLGALRGWGVRWAARARASGPVSAGAESGGGFFPRVVCAFVSSFAGKRRGVGEEFFPRHFSVCFGSCPRRAREPASRGVGN